MGHLSYSAHVRMAQLERSIPGMIEGVILAIVIPLQTSVDDLAVRVPACESRQEEASEVTNLQAKVADLRKDIDYLKSTEFTSLLKDDDDVDAPEIPLATTGDVHHDETTIKHESIII
ncbi:hypothetical protein H5410_015730 [Solanum commersonii]|uniref:Polyprotein protein n=1 Tax=Solanum commersonii TaxID=4109 RepID=A0A9J5ZV96_SOLCO|nr:hypothetical protein H5410_015730 [Solanum commersonii]